MTKQRRTFGCIQRMRKETYRLRWLDGGRRRSETVYGSRVQAERRLAEIQSSLDQTKPHMMTVGEIYQSLVFPEYERSLAPRTLANVTLFWNKHIEKEWSKIYVDELKASDFQRWLLTLPPEVARRSLSICRNVMKHAVMLEMVDHSPLDITFEMPTKATKTIDKSIIHGSSDLNKYYTAIKGSFVEVPFILGACAGLRPGEMLGIKVGEIEEYDQFAVVEVKRQVGDTGEIIENRDGTERVKTPGSKRYAVIMEPYASRLLQLQANAKKQKYVYMVDDGTGNPIGKNALRKQWHALCKLNGLDRILLRNLRPTFATNMHHEYGMQTEDIARLLGHTKPVITYETYERPNKADIVKTVMNNICPVES